MKIVKRLLVLFILAVITSAAVYAGGKKEAKIDELDAAIRDTSNYLNSAIPAKSKIVILNIQSDSPALSEYVIDELIANAVNDRIFSVVDRHQLDAIRAEQNFQTSGEVADNQALEIGKFFGAQTIVSGAITPLGSGHRIRVRALNVETAVVQGQFNRNISTSEMITAIKNTSTHIAAPTSTTAARPAAPATTTAQAAHPAQAAPPQPEAPAAPVAPAVHTYKIRDTGPAGGLIFYDKGNNQGGWRYLEAAPVEAEFQARWSVRNTKVDNTQVTIGSGKRNTQIIVETFSKASGEWDTAAQQCIDLEFGGFNDWFLPSKDELDQMYGNLKRRNLGDFKSWYWSSSMYISFGDAYAHNQSFNDGKMDADRITFTDSNYPRGLNVRPIRQVPGPN